MKTKIRGIIMMGMILALGMMAFSAPVKATLSELFQELGQPLPSVEDRAEEAAEFAIWDYTGTAEQNVLLERRMREALGLNEWSEDNLGYSVVSRYKTTLSSSMTATQSTLPVSSVTTFDGTTLTMGLLGTEVYFTVEPGSSKEEILRCTGISGTSWTNCTRGLAFSGTSTASVAGNRKSHNAGSVVVMSNTHYVFENFVDKDTDQTASGTIKFASGSATTTVQLGPDNDTYDKCIDITNGDTNLPFLCYDEDAGTAGTGSWVISHDGVNSFVLPTSTASVSTGGNGIDLTAGIVTFDSAATGTSGLGFTGNEATIVISSGLEINGDGIGIATTTDLTWSGGQTWANTTSTNSTSTNFYADVVSTTQLYVDSVDFSSIGGGEDSAADSTHSHAYNLGTQLLDDYYTFSTMVSSSAEQGWDSQYRQLEITASGMTTILTESGGETNAHTTNFLPGAGADSNMQFDGGKAVRMKIRVRATGTGMRGFGFMASKQSFDSTATSTDAGLRFVFIDGSLYASNATGSANTTTTISGITTTNWNTYEIVWDGANIILFYVNGTLEATHTTNSPSGTASAMITGFGIYKSGAMEISPITYSIEL